ncbi:hypothetical protein M2347_002790 [Chryseobacterium sp. H1D6B]|nr:hypothetical protein [Chryseobacterium sp. H1D6B]
MGKNSYLPKAGNNYFQKIFKKNKFLTQKKWQKATFRYIFYCIQLI